MKEKCLYIKYIYAVPHKLKYNIHIIKLLCQLNERTDHSRCQIQLFFHFAWIDDNFNAG